MNHERMLRRIQLPGPLVYDISDIRAWISNYMRRICSVMALIYIYFNNGFADYLPFGTGNDISTTFSVQKYSVSYVHVFT